tara:strand:+ start:9650 stop:12070 length:2421 start_codon:yes stop_codon:yes gene_type:complete
MATDTSNFNFQGIGQVYALTIYGCTNPNALNYDPAATASDGSCILPIYGCMDPDACNYDSSANQDNFTCEYCSCDAACISGCTDVNACNYDPLANNDDGSCNGHFGCTDSTAFNYDDTAMCADIASCVYVGCTDNGASNYDPNATVDDDSCIDCIYGCTDCGTIWETANSTTCPGGAATSPGSINFNPLATCDDGNCSAAIYGCTDPTANNQDLSANVNDGSCEYTVYGCADPLADNYYGSVSSNTALEDDDSCEYNGCTDVLACNYDESANTNDGSCVYPAGCSDNSYVEYDPSVEVDCSNVNDCVTLVVEGCTDLTAFNYDPLANTDDDSCIPKISGCTDSTACNYDSSANINDNTCTYPNDFEDCNGDCISGYVDLADGNGCVTAVYGCTDETLVNYNPSANVDDNSCGDPAVFGCTEEFDTNGDNYVNYNSSANVSDNSCVTCDNLDMTVNITTTDQTDSVNPNGGATITIPSDAIDIPYKFYLRDSQGSSWDNVVFNISSSWSIGSKTADTYTLQIESNNGCTVTQTFTINDNTSIVGCTDSTQFNYNSSATVDDGSCIPVISGCTDPSADNYDSNANTDDGSCTYLYPCPAPGTFIGGGWVFYTENIVGDTCNGLIVSHEDAMSSTKYKWGIHNVVDASYYQIGKGQQNTNKIINGNGCNNYGPGCDASQPITAAAIAKQHTTTVYGITYDDWYLPSAYELEEVAEVLSLSNNSKYALTPSTDGVYTDPNFQTGKYWSSSQYDPTDGTYSGNATEDAATVKFNSPGFTGSTAYLTIKGKGTHQYIRPIRSFAWDGANGIS